ncbi:radical SAM protein, partial [Candidatus Pacearchaeota archaeon]|nr:radical SAM protein [Candidatus Pacearchaeota archaeon]
SKRTCVDWTNLKPPFPKEVFIDVTNYCNHECFFCSNRKLSQKINLDKNLAFRIIDECAQNGTEDIGVYTTGEPFMRRDLSEFIAYAKKKGIKYVFLGTNGALAVPERAKEVLDAGLDSIKFSVNAGTRESYLKVHGRDDFDKVIENIKWIHNYREESGLTYGIYVSMVPSYLTENEFPLLEKEIGSYVDVINQRSCSTQGGNMYENNEKQEIDKKNLLGSLTEGEVCGKCPDLFTRAVVTPHGYLSACVVDYQNYLCVADLHEVTLSEAWHSDVYVDLRRRHVEGKLEGLMCNNCLNNVNESVEPIIKKYSLFFKN